MDLWALEPQYIKTSMSVSWKSVRFRKSSRNYEGSGRTGVKTVHCATKKRSFELYREEKEAICEYDPTAIFRGLFLI